MLWYSYPNYLYNHGGKMSRFGKGGWYRVLPFPTRNIFIMFPVSNKTEQIYENNQNKICKLSQKCDFCACVNFWKHINMLARIYG